MMSLRAVAIAVVLCLLSIGTARAEESGFIAAGGELWIEAVQIYWSADTRWFDRPTVSDGRFSHHATWLKLRFTPLDHLLLAVSVPVYQRGIYEQGDATTTTTATGDLFAAVGRMWTPRDWSVGTASYLSVKLPTTDPDLEDTALPLSDGQLDVALEQAVTWAVTPTLHVTGQLLARYRTEAQQQRGPILWRRDHGHELEFGAEVAGAPLESLWVKTGYRGLLAQESWDRTVPGSPIVVEQREVHWWSLGGYYRFGALVGGAYAGLALDVGLQWPLAGSDYLRGPKFSVGVAYATELWTDD